MTLDRFGKESKITAGLSSILQDFEIATRHKQMKILIAHRYFWPENISLFPRMIKDIAEWHIMNGDEVTILTSRSGGVKNTTSCFEKFL